MYAHLLTQGPTFHNRTANSFLLDHKKSSQRDDEFQVEGVWVMSDVARKLIRMRDPWIFK
jgi:hypothetical protein